MNRKELLVDFIKWFDGYSIDIFEVIKYPETVVDEYLEMLEAVEDLNDEI